MEHPFINDLSGKSLEELQETLSDLTNKLTFAYRTQNGALVNQLQMVIESYKNEQNKKLDALFKKQNIDTQINVQGEKR
jgi:hypothetical protein